MDENVKKVNKLIFCIAKGKISALEELYCLVGKLLFVMAKKYLYNKDYAEDLLNDVFLKLVKKADSFKKGYNGMNWLIKVVKNEAINHNIREKRNNYVELCENTAHAKDNVDDCLNNIMLTDALDKLDIFERKIIYLKFWEGHTVREIAEILKKPVTTTQDNIMKTMDKIKEYIR